MKTFYFTSVLLCFIAATTFAQNFTIQNNTQSVTILPNAIQSNRPEMTGKGNISIGKEALRLAGTGPLGNVNSIAIGDSALSNTNIGAIDVIAIGFNAAKNTGKQSSINGPGIINLAIGNNALIDNTTGYGNLAIGYKAINKGNNNGNVAIGHYALQSLGSVSSDNIAIGNNTMAVLTTGKKNITIGGMQLFQSGENNTSIGSESFGGANTSGYDNVSIGAKSLYSNKASGNTAIGTNAMFENTVGYNNTALGNNSMKNLASGYNNVAIGADALNASVSGGLNVAIGANALLANQFGNNNVAIGQAAGLYNKGSNNIFLGTFAGLNEQGNDKLYIANKDNNYPAIYGDLVSGQIGLSTNTPADQFVIYQTSSSLPNYAQWTNNYSGQLDNDGLEIGIQSGLDAFIWQNENKPLIVGTNNMERLRINADGLIGVGRTATTNIFEVEGEASKTTAGNWVGNSDKRLKKNIVYINSQDALQKVLQMKGAYYEWNDTSTGIKRPKGVQFGFIAQDLQQIFPAKVKIDNLGYLQTAYGDYDPMFVEAIKALNEKIERLEKENTALKTFNNDLLAMKSEFAELKEMIKHKAVINNAK